MTSLDANVIREQLGEATRRRLIGVEAFDTIASTNSYLLEGEAPPPGRIRVALTDNQVAGRGRHGRVWQSPPGSGLALSVGYTFATRSADFSALTLAIGVGAVEALEAVGVSGVQLKWPNDLIAGDGKLGGILTEAQPLAGSAVLVVSGLGLNLELDTDVAAGFLADGGRHAVDLAGYVSALPCRNELAARLIDGLCASFVDYQSAGFATCARRWGQRDWLRGRALTVDTPNGRVSGAGAGVAEDGALLVATEGGEVCRVTSGSVVEAGVRQEPA